MTDYACDRSHRGSRPVPATAILRCADCGRVFARCADCQRTHPAKVSMRAHVKGVHVQNRALNRRVLPAESPWPGRATLIDDGESPTWEGPEPDSTPDLVDVITGRRIT